MKYKLTKKKLKYFEKKCLYWVKKFNLQTWELFIKPKNNKEYRAQCQWDFESKIACINISIKWGNHKPTKKELNKVALHEVLELLFSVLREAASGNLKLYENEIDNEIHSIIHIVSTITSNKK